MPAKPITATLLLLLYLLGAAHAEEPWIDPVQNTPPEIRGTVVDPDGTPVPGAIVRCDFYNIQCETDAEGRFALPIASPQYHRLRVYRPDKSQLALSTFLFQKQAEKETGEFRIPLFPARKLTGKVLDANGNPIPGGTVWCSSTINQEITDIGETDPEGNFVLHHPANHPLGLVAAQKSGHGIDFFSVNEPYPPKEGLRPEEKVARGEVENGPFTVTLSGAKTVRFKAVDGSGNPLEGIEFSVWVFQKKDDFLNPVGLDFIRQKTDASGIAVFDWLPNWTLQPVEFAGRLQEPPNRWLPRTLRVELQAPPEELTVVFEPGVFVRGTVRLPDGQPAENWMVTLSPGRGLRFLTDRRGRYQFYLERNQGFQISVRQWDKETSSPTKTPVGVAPTRFNMNSGESGLERIDIQLQRPTRLFGRVIGNPPQGEPEHRSRIRIGEGNPEFLDSGDDNRAFWNDSSHTILLGEDGTFESWLPSGTFKLYPGDRYPRSNDDVKTLEITDQPEIRVDFELKQISKFRDIVVRLERPDGSTNKLGKSTVVLFEQGKESDDEPYMVSENAGEDGTVKFKTPDRAMKILAVTPDNRFGRYAMVAPDQTNLMLNLLPTGSVAGTITNDHKVGEPLVGRKVEARPKGVWGLPARTATTDAKGRFEVSGLVPGVGYELHLPLTPRDWPDTVRAWRPLQSVKPESSKTVDIGTVSCSPQLDGGSEFSWAFWGLYVSHLGGKNFETLFQELLERGKNENRRLLVLFTENEHDSLYRGFSHVGLAETFYNDPVVAPLFDRFLFMGVPTDKQSHSGEAYYGKAKAFAKRLGVGEDAVDQPTLCVFDTDGKLLHTDTLSEIMEYGPIRDGKPRITVNKPRLIEFLHHWTPGKSDPWKQ